jgi:flagella basal body P-ring formation protein FlgA
LLVLGTVLAANYAMAGKMTTRWRLTATCLAVLSCGASMRATATATSPDQEWESHDRIRAAAATTVGTGFEHASSRVEAVADALDPRVRLQACAKPLAVSVPYGKKRGPRVTAEVRCPAPKPWKIYVPVRLTVFQPVVVATRVLPRGTVLSPEDMELAEYDTGALAYGYLARAEDAVGHRLRRPLGRGDALSPGVLETPALIRRGQRVTLQARSGGFTVRMAGVAKADGGSFRQWSSPPSRPRCCCSEKFRAQP